MITLKINYGNVLWEEAIDKFREIDSFLRTENIQFVWVDVHATIPDEMYIMDDEIATWIKIKFNV